MSCSLYNFCHHSLVHSAAASVSTGKYFTSFYVGTYLPFTVLSYSFEYRFFGLKPFIYHLDNLLLHSINAVIVFLVILMLSGKIPLAALTALFFSLHPLWHI